MTRQRKAGLFFAALCAAAGVFFAPPAEATHIFQISTAPSSGTVAVGENISFVITATCNSSCSSPINFALSGLPADAVQSFNPASIIPNGSTMATITAGNTTGPFTLTVLAGGEPFPSSTYALTINSNPVSYNMRGWAWSENIGWISFNSQNCDTNFDQLMSAEDRTNPVFPNDPASAACPPDGTPVISYGAHLDLSTYELLGSAWSERVGWITFDKSTAGTPPAPPYNNGSQTYIAKLVNGKLEGWARAASCPGTQCDQDSQWGWIKLSGTAGDGSTYDVGSAGNDLLGFAWGSSVLGWLSFAAANCDIDGDGTINRALGDSAAPAGCPPNGTAIPSYRTRIAGTLPNAPPVALNPRSTFENRCSLNAPHAQKFTFTYRDNEGDPLAQYTIKVYNANSGALVASPDAVECSGIPGCTYDPFLTAAYTGPTYPYDPAPRQGIQKDVPYTGSALTYGNVYYFTVTVQDPEHLN